MSRPEDPASAVAAFYDGFADDYHLIYQGRWEEAVERQADALNRLIRNVHPRRPVDVLDSSCGIGTQAIGLALLGYHVVGTDISERSLERARLEAERLGAEVAFAAADFRDLSSVGGRFDVVLSCDNAIPHLRSDADILRAFRAMRSKLRADGVLVVSVRDYDRDERPAVGAPVLVPGPPRHVLLRLHEWDAPESDSYTVRFLVLTEGAGGWEVVEHSTRYRAVGRATLAAAALDAGFVDIAWHEPEKASWHQPVLTARAAS